MNVKRFTAKSSREALGLVRQAFGEDAVVVSTRPCAEGVEVLAMAPEAVQQFERAARQAPTHSAAAQRRGAPAARPPQGAAPRASAPAARASHAASGGTSVEQDVEELAMSTLSFQDYVRERMLKRRQAELGRAGAGAQPAPAAPEPAPAPAPAPERRAAARRDGPTLDARAPMTRLHDEPEHAASHGSHVAAGLAAPNLMADDGFAAPRREQLDMINELRSMRGLIEQRFDALAFMEKLQRQPRQAQLSQRLLDHGLSPSLIRKLVDALPDDVDEGSWAADVLARNLAACEAEPPLEEQGGVYALIGSTGVGKTTSTAKLAAAFAARHGAGQLGLVTLDAYRVGAHEQLRTYGRILGVPVHTAHDRASLEDLLELLAAKKMVLIDTAGTAQRDARTRELLDMLTHRSIQRLLVVNASAQGETIEDVLVSYRAATCKGAILSKIDEAVKLGPAVDAMIRHRVPVLGVANGQRVPEDWHRLSAAALVQRALRGTSQSAWRLDAGDVNLVFAGLPGTAAPAAGPRHSLQA